MGTGRIGGAFADLSTLSIPMAFVLGRGETMPFPAESFDAVVALWSLNHAFSPRMVVDECHRVLKPAGRLLLVLEDVEPLRADLSNWPLQLAIRCLLTKGTRRRVNRPWPVQSDHVRIDERQMVAWTRDGFALERRAWTKPGRSGYLSLLFSKH